jgi:small subunit ribosomal protein S16
MVVIRLARRGRRNRPFFTIVATDSRSRRDGGFVEQLGFYNPISQGKAESLRIASDRLGYWQSVGAKLSPTMQRLVKQQARMEARPVPVVES